MDTPQEKKKAGANSGLFHNSLPELGRSGSRGFIVLFMGEVDTVFRHICHEISGGTAMERTQFCGVFWWAAVPVVALGLCFPALAAGIAHDSRPDPLLDGRADGPCAALSDSPDYAPGVDAQGQPVDPPDVGAPPVAIPDQVMVPLPGGRHGARHHAGAGSYAAIDGRRLKPLVNPARCPR
jgi:hypothetical protein